MVASDHDRRLQFAALHHLVEREAEAVALAEADPADACGKALEGYPLARHVEPFVQMLVVGDQLLHLGVGLVDVLRVARQGAPAERTDAAAEERPDIGRHEAWKGEGVFQPFLERHLADVIAVVERRHAGIPEIDHRGDVHLHRGAGRLLHCGGIAFLLVAPFGDRPALRQVAVDRVMGRGLVGDDVGMYAAPDQFGENIGGVGDQADGLGFAGLRPVRDHLERLVERTGFLVQISGP